MSDYIKTDKVLDLLAGVVAEIIKMPPEHTEERTETHSCVSEHTETHEDLISRKAAILETWREPRYTDPFNVLTEIRDRLRSLPSEQPERKKGKWILDPDGMDWNLPAWRCSLCGCRNDNIGVVAKGEGLGQNPLMWAGSKYCPNCGARMGQEGEDNDS